MRCAVAALVLLLAGCASTPPAPPKDELTWGELAIRYGRWRGEMVRHIDWITGACAGRKLDQSKCQTFHQTVAALTKDTEAFETFLKRKIDTPGTSGSPVDGETLSRFLTLGLAAAKIAALAGVI